MEAISGAVRLDVAGTLASAAGGDEIAFARLVESHDAAMYRVCMAVGRDHGIASDAVQAAWTIAWRKLGSVRDPERLRAWLITVAVNETKSLLRSRRKRSLTEVSVDATSRPGGLDPAVGVSSIDLRDLLERLDPDDRALLAMRYVAGFNSTELARALGISPSGTRTRLERLVARLRQELSDG
ncbi:MAG: sigma-70 family RNA polymerase sigma factor [Candidatus Limnocylindrales bacterium]